MPAWVPFLLVLFGGLIVLFCVLLFELRRMTKAQLTEFDKRLTKLENRVTVAEDDIRHLRDEMNTQEPISPLAAIITSAATALAGAKGKAMLPTLGMLGVNTLIKHVLPAWKSRAGRQKALPKK